MQVKGARLLYKNRIFKKTKKKKNSKMQGEEGLRRVI